MFSMIRTIAKLCTVFAAVAAVQPTTLSYAADSVAYASSTGSGSSCTTTQPCTIVQAVATALSAAGTNIARVICLSPPAATPENTGNVFSLAPNQTIEIDCPQGYMTTLQFLNSNVTGVIRGVTFTNSIIAPNPILFWGSGTLILEDCVFTDTTGMALDIEPNGPLNLVFRNSRISKGATVAIVLKPAAGGSINATFDHVTVTNNAGGGIRLDTTNGPVTADVTDSVITNNTGNGLSAQGGAGGAAMLSIHNSVIAKNGAAGINATGTNGAVLVDTTLLDTNGTATSIASGGRIVSYGNNRVVGPAGTGFTGTASLQ